MSRWRSIILWQSPPPSGLHALIVDLLITTAVLVATMALATLALRGSPDREMVGWTAVFVPTGVLLHHALAAVRNRFRARSADRAG